MTKLGNFRRPADSSELQWTIGSLKNNSEPLIDELVELFTKQMTEMATNKKEVQLGEWLAYASLSQPLTKRTYNN